MIEIVGPLVTLALVLGSKAAPEPKRPMEIDDPAQATKIVDAAQILGLPEGWGVFLAATAATESGIDPGLVRGVPLGCPPGMRVKNAPGEARAAARSYERRKDVLPFEAKRYRCGSVGAWQQQPAIWAAHVGDERDPWLMADPKWQIWGIARYYRSCMAWRGFRKNPIWANLRVCGRAPGRMGKKAEIDRQMSAHRKLGDALVALGYPREFGLRDVPETPYLAGSGPPEQLGGIW